VSVAPVVRSRAPLRLSFCGGGTDVSPYPEQKGGVVLSTTIDKYAYASLEPRRDVKFGIHSLDFDLVAKYPHPRKIALDGNLDLIKGVVRAFGPKRGADLYVHSDAPPGSGLGSSSTMAVAVVAALKAWLSRPLTPYEMAELAYRIERVDLAIAGGRQDQYAATFGGFNFIEFHADATIVNPLRIAPDTLHELEYRMVLAYLRQTRSSARIIERQSASFAAGKREVVGALDRLKALTFEMKRVLLLGQLDAFGEMLHEAWLSKKHLDSGITTDPVDDLYDAARKAGAIGGKMPGAGGGGYFVFLCRPHARPKVSAVLEAHGAQLVPFAFTSEGVTTWSVARRPAARAGRVAATSARRPSGA
jgi:D-glycero-alpha-D-manno-heptose-7-phosphate kinase